jgi:protein-S-isoprenylcysteine O-methyltransferase Ste14
MYLANLLIYVFSPLALGSFWATPVLTLGTILMLVHRIRNEEEVLAEKLDGYREFVQRTRFRLIPGVW